MDAYAERAAAEDEILVEIAGRTLPVAFRASADNPLWLGGDAGGDRLFHWSCRLGGDAPIEFHHTQSWPDFDAATAVSCLMADAEDVQAAGSFSAWIERCGLDAPEAGELRGRLTGVYEAILTYLPFIQGILTPVRTEDALCFEPSFAA
ncbi:hypothetical protein BHAOGJBA_2963 [Methylobacterium hispanicum]|uniref:Uncharacterized protein n=1 Tax=Methylobacterium hispanicum TaxID=270350 RepID=A0AAV4ZLN1_9HYPH|nr:hypothetical protein [Methylobacterium hispanicum]GJD89436.1 hypothetical protein BHAOGJBA_2963 [Methylobacterium hispanicum]